MKILLVSGSGSDRSHTRALLAHIEQLALGRGHTAMLADLKSSPLPFADAQYHKDPTKHPSPAVVSFVEQVEASDAIVLGSPLYQGSYSGILKNALDHLRWDAFRGKKVGVVSNAGGVRKAGQANLLLVPVVQTLFGQPTQTQIGTVGGDYSAALEVEDQDIKDRCARLIDELDGTS